jgi:hypothetical protein
MPLDDVWLQTTLNTPNISGVWQISFMFFLEFVQSPDYDFFNIFYGLFLCSFGILLPMFQTNPKKKKKPASGL